jgi:hypothetical protein
MIATKGEGIAEMMKMVALLQKENQKRVWTRELNKALQSEIIQRPPRFPKNKIAKILYATQVAVDAPTFIIFVNHKSRVNFAFKKWVENTIRKYFGFIGVPIVVKYRNRGEGWEKIPENWSENFREWDEHNEEYKDDDLPRSTNSNNPHTNKGKRKRDTITKWRTPLTRGEGISKSSGARWERKRGFPKRDSKYSNTKKADQKKLDAMFSKVYGEKKVKKRI